MPYADPVNYALPFISNSETSREAAVTAKSFAPTQLDRYFTWLLAQGSRGGTDKEASAALGIARMSLCCRRMELKRAGLIEQTGYKRDGCAAVRVK